MSNWEKSVFFSSFFSGSALMDGSAAPNMLKTPGDGSGIEEIVVSPIRFCSNLIALAISSLESSFVSIVIFSVKAELHYGVIRKIVIVLNQPK